MDCREFQTVTLHVPQPNQTQTRKPKTLLLDRPGSQWKEAKATSLPRSIRVLAKSDGQSIGQVTTRGQANLSSGRGTTARQPKERDLQRTQVNHWQGGSHTPTQSQKDFSSGCHLDRGDCKSGPKLRIEANVRKKASDGEVVLSVTSENWSAPCNLWQRGGCPVTAKSR